VIFRVVPEKRSQPHRCTSLFLAYVQRFDIVPQLIPGSSSKKGLCVEPSTGMYLLKRARRSDGSILGDIIPLGHVRTLVDLVPRFGPIAEKRLTKETSLESSSEFWLNKYLDKENFYALSCS